MKWKPIKSAPKDGTRLLLTDGYYYSTGAYNTLSIYGRWTWGECHDPTHWMEITKLPKKKTRK